MIKKIIQWIRGTNNNSTTTNAADAPYKVDAPFMEEGSWPSYAEETNETVVKETVAEPVVKSKKKTTTKKPAAIKTTPVNVAAKYKKVELDKMSKKELQDLITKHSIETKSRTTKDEMVKALLKV